MLISPFFWSINFFIMFFELLIYPMWGKKIYKNDLGLLVKKLRYSGLQVEMRMGKDN